VGHIESTNDVMKTSLNKSSLDKLCGSNGQVVGGKSTSQLIKNSVKFVKDLNKPMPRNTS